MTRDQASQLDTLSQEAGEEVPDGLTEEAASEKIDELRAKTGSEDHEPDDARHTPITPNANR